MYSSFSLGNSNYDTPVRTSGQIFKKLTDEGTVVSERLFQILRTQDGQPKSYHAFHPNKDRTTVLVDSEFRSILLTPQPFEEEVDDYLVRGNIEDAPILLRVTLSRPKASCGSIPIFVIDGGDSYRTQVYGVTTATLHRRTVIIVPVIDVEGVKMFREVLIAKPNKEIEAKLWQYAIQPLVKKFYYLRPLRGDRYPLRYYEKFGCNYHNYYNDLSEDYLKNGPLNFTVDHDKLTLSTLGVWSGYEGSSFSDDISKIPDPDRERALNMILTGDEYVARLGIVVNENSRTWYHIIRDALLFYYIFYKEEGLQ